jgi:methyltransferase-like protein
MLITHISVDYGQKINLGNFESVNVSINIHGKPEDGEDADACYEFLLNQAQQVVMSKLLEVTEAHNVTCPSVVKYFAGKEIDEFPSSIYSELQSNLPF